MGRAGGGLAVVRGVLAVEPWHPEALALEAAVLDALGQDATVAGDVNGDGYGDVIGGAPYYDDGENDDGAAFVYLGNGGDGTTPLARAPLARQTSSTTPITPGQITTSEATFDVAFDLARGPWGRARVGLAIEVKALGEAFDGTDLHTSDWVDATDRPRRDPGDPDGPRCGHRLSLARPCAGGSVPRMVAGMGPLGVRRALRRRTGRPRLHLWRYLDLRRS